MAVALSGLPCVTTFDNVGEPETLSQRWTLWKAEYKLYVAASGIGPKKKDSCVQVSEVKKIRVGRSKNIFILDFFFIINVQGV